VADRGIGKANGVLLVVFEAEGGEIDEFAETFAVAFVVVTSPPDPKLEFSASLVESAASSLVEGEANLVWKESRKLTSNGFGNFAK
jgi:hypothetical protein